MRTGSGTRCFDVAIEPPRQEAIRAAVDAALMEDRATDDVTTLATVPAARRGLARFVAREAGVLAGMPVVEDVFWCLDRDVRVRALVEEGEAFEQGTVLAEAEGPVRALLQGERMALNFLQRLCGTATMT